MSMWTFLSRRLRRWVLFAIAWPVARLLVRRLARTADHRDPSTRTAKTLRRVDSAVATVSRRSSRRAAGQRSLLVDIRGDDDRRPAEKREAKRWLHKAADTRPPWRRPTYEHRESGGVSEPGTYTSWNWSWGIGSGAGTKR